MHVAIVGAGSLGCVYGVRLALGANETVSFVVRSARLGVRHWARASAKLRTEDALLERASPRLEHRQRAHRPQVRALHCGGVRSAVSDT